LIPVSEEDDGEVEQDHLRGELLDLADACGRRGDGEPRTGTPLANGGPSLGHEGGDSSIVSETQISAPPAERRHSLDCEDEGAPRAQAPAPTPTPGSGTPPRPETEDPPLTRDNDMSTPSAGREPGKPLQLECTACSFANNLDTALCVACANVLEPRKMQGAWRCSCYGDLRYLNAGDAGVCGICGQRKSARR
jgi:hypothetical protein